MKDTITETVYTIDDHPNPEAVYGWVRNNWHDIGEHSVHEMVDSLKALADHVGGTLDYSIGLFLDRGEFVRITGGNRGLLKGLMAKDCPLTGVCYDYDVIEGYRGDNLEVKVLEVLHNEGDYIYSNKGIHEMVLCNDYYFKSNGELEYELYNATEGH